MTTETEKAPSEIETGIEDSILSLCVNFNDNYFIKLKELHLPKLSLSMRRNKFPQADCSLRRCKHFIIQF